MEDQLSWRDVLDCKKEYGHITRLGAIALSAGYDYVSWNERIYKVRELEGRVQWLDTDILARDLKGG